MTSLEQQQRAKITTLILAPIQECRCGTRIDVSRYEPLQELTCPSCAGPFVVQGQLDRFALVGIAGHGGTGTVYKAQDPQLGRPVALKVVREDRATDEEVLAQLEAEATITASLKHPHVLRVFSVGRAQGRFFIAMELVQGGSLEDLLAKHKVLPEIQALEIAIQIASGLQAAHEAGLVHRDVKPGNVLFSNASTAKVMDFGLAIFERQAAAANGTVWGTPFYMPPERLEGVAEDFRSDIYSLGTVLFQMLTGRPPFDAGTPQEVAMKRLSHPAPSVLTYAPRVSNATAFVVKKMLERDREARFQSYADLIQSLQYARAELGQRGAAKSARVVLDETPARKAGMWVTVAIAAFVLIACIAAVMMVRKARAKDEVTPIPVIASVAAKPANPLTPAIPEGMTTRSTANILPGVYNVKNRKTGQVLDVYAWNSNKDAEIKTWPGGYGVNQRWIIRPVNGGHQLVALHSCKALEVLAGSQDDSALIGQGTLSGAAQQTWRFEPTSGNYYRLVAQCSGKALTVLDATLPSGAPIGQRAIGNGEEQQWTLVPHGGVPPELEDVLHGRPLGTPPPMVVAKPGTDPKGSRFVPVSLREVVNCDSRMGTFRDPKSVKDTVRPLMTGWVDAGGVPFDVIANGQSSTGNDLLILRGGLGNPRYKYPKKVEVPVDGARFTKLHFLGGVGGWGYPWDGQDKHVGVLAAQVTVVRRGGGKEVLTFRNGLEIADYNARHEVPNSAYVGGFADYNRQVRVLSKPLGGTEPVEKLIIEGFETNVAPLFVAITGEVAP